MGICCKIFNVSTGKKFIIECWKNILKMDTIGAWGDKCRLFTGPPRSQREDHKPPQG